jgi:hypothetical protein
MTQDLRTDHYGRLDRGRVSPTSESTGVSQPDEGGSSRLEGIDKLLGVFLGGEALAARSRKGMGDVAYRLTPPVANREMAATAMMVAVVHPRMLAVLPLT